MTRSGLRTILSTCFALDWQPDPDDDIGLVADASELGNYDRNEMRLYLETIGRTVSTSHDGVHAWLWVR